jgi:RNA polymerase sigma-70 factor, ECF subfamily
VGYRAAGSLAEPAADPRSSGDEGRSGELETPSGDGASALDEFLASVERRALRMAELATRDRDEALDVVQDAMISLVKNYADRPQAEWPPLFHRILQSRIRDWGRRSSLRARFRAWLGRDDEEDGVDPIAEVADPDGRGPAEHVLHAAAGRAIETAIETLPLRQKQAFLLRAWEGLDVAETAAAMSCSEGSVKTHYFRAVHALRAKLGEDWA